MTRDDAKQLLPIIQAYAEGKRIEFRCDGLDVWDEVTSACFEHGPENYRIKPEPIECWAVVFCDNTVYMTYDKRSVAEKRAAEGNLRVIRMREVHE